MKLDDSTGDSHWLAVDDRTGDSQLPTVVDSAMDSHGIALQ